MENLEISPLIKLLRSAAASSVHLFPQFIHMQKSTLLLAGVFFIISCNNRAVESSKPDILASNIDSTVSPGEDFFLYANGGWIKKNPIPAEESGWGIGYLVNEEIYNRKRKINEDALKANAKEGSIEQKIADFWYSGMDTAGIEAQGIKPLQPDLDKITAMKTPADIVKLAADFHSMNVNVLFSDGVSQDDKNSEAMAYFLSQGGIGMPNRDYYFNTDERTVNIRKAYKEYMTRIFKQLGANDADAAKLTANVFDLETRLAKASRKLVDLRDPYKNYNKKSVDQLSAMAGNINWKEYMAGIGISKLDSAIVGQPEFFTALNKELVSTPVEIWKSYFRFHLLKNFSQFLDSASFNSAFEYNKTLSGARQPRPRWKRVLDAEEYAIGEALGQLFVKQYFNETAKKRYSDLVEAIRDAFKERIKNLSWMSDSTKQKAYDKLAKMSKKVGYPDKWKDFSALKIDRGPFVLNMQKARRWWHQYDFNKLGKPVDRTEWDMTPQTYNAYYNPSNNEIVLPAGMFAVPGMKDEELDDAFVYGYAAASTIGHEITHGFDDQGRQYDAKGNLTGWWMPSDSIEFTKRAQVIIKQFNAYNPVDTLHVNGEATQGENIADLGGLLLGLDAFRKTESYKSGKKIGGFTPLQRYFLGYAYSWMYEIRKESLANLVLTDVHSPEKERVNGPVVNIPAFYEAFNIKPTDKMYRPDSLRVRIW